MDRGAFHLPHHAHAMPAQLPLAAFAGPSPRQSLAQPPGLTVPWEGAKCLVVLSDLSDT